METITGYVENIIYQNSENGYTVLSLCSDGEETILIGSLSGIDEGENIEVQGVFATHPVYGSQLKVSSYRTLVPTDAGSMERYLGSGAIKGIGEALAARIVKYHGADTFRIIEEEPERLSEIKGISERMAMSIAEQVQEKKEMREAFVFLQQYGISSTMAVKIYNTYGIRLYSIMKLNPYQLAEDISGIGFRIADDIALSAGVSIESEFRIRSGIMFVLQTASADGHTFLPKSVLLAKCEEMLKVLPDHIENQLEHMLMDKKIYIRKNNDQALIYHAALYYTELKCAKMLVDLSLCIPPIDTQEWTKIKLKLEDILYQQEIEADELQLKAVEESIRQGVVVISGGPGTGKTTTINSIIKFFAAEKRNILLAAPTGRAAKRMTEATGYEAKTIHRLLEVKAGANKNEDNGTNAGDDMRNIRFERNDENPLEADVVIVDEMSMVDLNLFAALLKAISPGTRLILVGDMDQLPSVGAGQILKDIIRSNAFATVILKNIFRQAKESDIVLNAHRINHGEQLVLDNKSRDFFFLERSDTNVIYKHMIQLITEKLPAYVEADPWDIQVLTPMRKGPLGVVILNQILQKYLNPPGKNKNEYQSGEILYREGDKVMQIKNNYMIEWEILSKYNIAIDSGTGIYNGDSGIIKEIKESSGTLVVEYDECRRVTYQLSNLDEIELAYAITIHKAQGSEYPAVIMPLLNGPRMLFNRNLLYTGVTRAKRLVAILGLRETIADMVSNVSSNTRYSSLHERINEVKCS
ncbi:MAG: ATP-dependent RecD-like DNA helicase [Lachnospiraceae bacterium]|nr:ATP-dependent RecD-like DNA helicase [Lachnospiraceae bacterium]